MDVQATTRTFLYYTLVLAFCYLLLKITRHIRYNYQVRTNPEYAKIPSLPRHWLLGNVVNAGAKLDPSLDRHPDYGMEEIWTSLDRPPCFWLDFALAGIHILVVADAGLAELISESRPDNKYSFPKSDTTQALHRLLGDGSMVTAEGEEWRTLRRRFNKGFAPAHLHTLAPLILDRTRTFIDRLKSAAETKTTFTMRECSQDLTTDIITMVSMERDFGAQTCPPGKGEKAWWGILTTSRKLSQQAFKVGQGFNILYFLDPVRPFKSWLNELILNWRLYRLVEASLTASSQYDEKYSSTANGTTNTSEKPTSPNQESTRSIITLATDSLAPTPALIKNTVSQLKTFLFAGQDTTSTLIQCLCYELSRCTSLPKSHPLHSHYTALYTALLAEHNSVFSSSSSTSTTDPFSALHHPFTESTFSALPITNAWVKETLRLYPPAGTARLVPPISPTTPPYHLPIPAHNNTPPTKATINGLRVYNCHYLIHRSPSLWGDDATLFNPTRWLDDGNSANVPVGSYRPFERGPRNCIGQTLAVMEGVVVLCAVARGLKFEKVDPRTGEVDVEGEAGVCPVREKREGRESGGKQGGGGGGGGGGGRGWWMQHQVTAVPGDGMLMRVKLRDGSEGCV